MLSPRRAILHSSDPAIARAWNWQMDHWDALVSCDSASLRCMMTRPDGAVFREVDSPLEALAWIADDARHLAPDARWVGYIGYDLGQLFEQLPRAAADDLALPLFAFVRGRGGPVARVVALADWRPSRARLPGSTFTQDAYQQAVARAVEYIAAGDIFQVNLSQRFAVERPADPGALFGRLTQAGGAHYGALLDFGEFALISDSPELFLHVVRRDDGSRLVLTRPIKGTRPRAPGMDLELKHSIKDQAELNMIVDLERNDLGRVCRIGSVRVRQPRTIEAHPTVYHAAATVQGILRDDVGLVELLAATFPGGSITGAPKIRAMQIIDQLEPVRRGAYCGAIGYLAADGSMQFNLAIRTITCRDAVAYVPVGGGIVADSQPAAEYDETLVKARAMFAALGIERPGAT